MSGRSNKVRGGLAIVVAAGLVATTLGTAPPVADAEPSHPPRLAVGDVAVPEGDLGVPSSLKVPITLSHPAAEDVFVEWLPVAGTASAGTDFTNRSKPGRTRIPAGRTWGYATVHVLRDTVVEGDESFDLVLGAVTGPAELGTRPVGTVTVLDDDPGAGPALAVGDAAVVEGHVGEGRGQLPLVLSEPLAAGTVEVTWRVAGAAKARTTKIRPGKTRTAITVKVPADEATEPDEAVAVSLEAVSVTGSSETVDVTRAVGTLTVLDDDPAPEVLALGRGRNYLGTGNQNPTAHRENLWLSAAGYCSRKEHGDRITARADNNGWNEHFSCVPAGPNPGLTQVQPNRDFRAEGYVYTVTFGAAATQSWNLEVFDAPHCEAAGTGAGDSGTVSNNNVRSGERAYRFAVRADDGPDPFSGTVLTDIVLRPSDCAAWANAWRSLATFGAGATGRYHLQVEPLVPAVQTGAGAQEGNNQFGLRLRPTGGPMVYCSPDPGLVSVPDPACPTIAAHHHLGVYANLTSSSPQTTIPLATIRPEHAGRTLEIEVFDPAEGALGIEILDPTGNPATFTWQVACQDGSYKATPAAACPTSEQPSGPPGGWGPATTSYLDVSGTAASSQRPWRPCQTGATPPVLAGCITQNGRYSDRTLRLVIPLPVDLEAAYGGASWWRLRYTVPFDSSGLGDRATWSVRVV